MNLTTHIITRHEFLNRSVPKGVVIVHDEARGWLPAAQNIFKTCESDIIGLLHDDLDIHDDDWRERVMGEFANPQIAVVGFGGATSIGHLDIYKIPYHYTQLARGGFLSNLTDAESHGKRHTGSTDVAVLDSFSLFIRREFLTAIGGWPVDKYAPSHMADIWICLKAAQQGMKVRMVGVGCSHYSGGRGSSYPAWAATTKWGSDEEMHRVNHQLIYDDFKDTLPLVIPEPEDLR